MKASLKWLNKYVDLDGVSVDEIAEALPMLGLEVEGIETTGLKPLDKVVVGEILSREPHPDSDHLGVCMVKIPRCRTDTNRLRGVELQGRRQGSSRANRGEASHGGRKRI